MPAASIEVICNMALGYAGVRTRINSINEASVAAQTCKTYYEQYRDDLLNAYRWPFATRRVQLTVFTGAAWSSTQTYNLGDLVTYGVRVYRSLVANNTGNQPDISQGQWFQVTRDGWTYAAYVPSDMISPMFVFPLPNANTAAVTAILQSLYLPPQLSPLRNPHPDERYPFAIEDSNDGTGQQIILTDAQSPVLVYTAQITNPASFSTPFCKALAWKLAVPIVAAMRADPKMTELMEKKADKEEHESIATEMRDIREDVEPSSEFEKAREN